MLTSLLGDLVVDDLVVRKGFPVVVVVASCATITISTVQLYYLGFYKILRSPTPSQKYFSLLLHLLWQLFCSLLSKVE